MSRSCRAWVEHKAASRIIGWPGFRARVDLISSFTVAGLGRECSKSHASIGLAKNGHLQVD